MIPSRSGYLLLANHTNYGFTKLPFRGPFFILRFCPFFMIGLPAFWATERLVRLNWLFTDTANGHLNLLIERFETF